MRRRGSFRVNLKLDPDHDADLIGWIERHRPGTRSEAIRDALRHGIGLKQSEMDVLAGVVHRAVAEALAGVQATLTSHGPKVDTDEIERAFGEKLDQLLGGFG